MYFALWISTVSEWLVCTGITVISWFDIKTQCFGNVGYTPLCEVSSIMVLQKTAHVHTESHIGTSCVFRWSSRQERLVSSFSPVLKMESNFGFPASMRLEVTLLYHTGNVLSHSGFKADEKCAKCWGVYSSFKEHWTYQSSNELLW